MKTFDIANYLKERNYLVRLRHTDYGCVIIFPEQCMMHHTSPMVRVECHVDMASELVQMIGSNNFRNTHTVPPYALKAFLMYYTVNVCDNIYYNPNMITFQVGGKTVEDSEFWEQCCDRPR